MPFLGCHKGCCCTILRLGPNGNVFSPRVYINHASSPLSWMWRLNPTSARNGIQNWKQANPDSGVEKRCISLCYHDYYYYHHKLEAFVLLWFDHCMLVCLQQGNETYNRIRMVDVNVPVREQLNNFWLAMQGRKEQPQVWASFISYFTFTSTAHPLYQALSTFQESCFVHLDSKDFHLEIANHRLISYDSQEGWKTISSNTLPCTWYPGPLS